MMLEMPYRWKRMGDEDAAASPAAGPAAPSEDLYAAASEHVRRIQNLYAELLSAVDQYEEWLRAEVRAEQAKPEPDSAKIQALNPQIKYLAELSEGLEGPAHDGLVRVSDRAVRIKHWQDGVFI